MVTIIKSAPLSSGNLKMKWGVIKERLKDSDKPVTETKFQEILDELVDAVGQVINNVERRR